MRPAFFWNFTQSRLSAPYRGFGTSHRSHLHASWNPTRKPFFLDSLPVKMGLIGCPETSVRNYHYTLRNIQEERRSNFHRGESLKSRIKILDEDSCLLKEPYQTGGSRILICFVCWQVKYSDAGSIYVSWENKLQRIVLLFQWTFTSKTLR